MSSFFSCGYVLMPKYIRSYIENVTPVDTGSMSLKIRIIAVRHIRTNHVKSISKVIVKTTIISKPKSAESQIYLSIFVNIDFFFSLINIYSHNYWSMWDMGF
jgi:hypothetical protein